MDWSGLDFYQKTIRNHQPKFHQKIFSIFIFNKNIKNHPTKKPSETIRKPFLYTKPGNHQVLERPCLDDYQLMHESIISPYIYFTNTFIVRTGYEGYALDPMFRLRTTWFKTLCLSHYPIIIRVYGLLYVYLTNTIFNCLDTFKLYSFY